MSGEVELHAAVHSFLDPSLRGKRPPSSPERTNLCQVVPRLWLASSFEEREAKHLKAKRITHICQVGSELSPTHAQGFTYMHVDILDMEEEDIVMHLPPCIEFIDQGRSAGGVLVHCVAGVSRSASVVIAYLMTRDGMTLSEAFNVVKAARPIINPNDGFMRQLHLYQRAGCTTQGWEPWNGSRYLTERWSVDEEGEGEEGGERGAGGAGAGAAGGVVARVGAVEPDDGCVAGWSNYLSTWKAAHHQ